MLLHDFYPALRADTQTRDMDFLWSELFGLHSAKRSRSVVKDTAVRRTANSVTPLAALDLTDHGDSVALTVEVPGIKKDKISITIDNNILTIKAGNYLETRNEDKKYYIRERSRKNLYRQITLPVEVDPNRISASLTDGILEIKLHKLKEAKPKKIKVEVV